MVGVAFAGAFPFLVLFFISMSEVIKWECSDVAKSVIVLVFLSLWSFTTCFRAGHDEAHNKFQRNN